MFRRIALTLIITIILALFTGPSAHLAENELTPCDFVERFGITIRPKEIGRDLNWIIKFPGFGEITEDNLEQAAPIKTVEQLENVKDIKKTQKFLLRALYNLKGEKPCYSKADHILINEFDPNPAEGEEYVELYNPTDCEVDISGWILDSFDEGTTVIEKEIVVEADSYHVIHLEQGWLKDENDLITLFNKDGNLVDHTLIVRTPGCTNFSWQRCPNGQDTDSDKDWHFKQSTPKANNEC